MQKRSTKSEQNEASRWIIRPEESALSHRLFYKGLVVASFCYLIITSTILVLPNGYIGALVENSCRGAIFETSAIANNCIFFEKIKTELGLKYLLTLNINLTFFCNYLIFWKVLVLWFRPKLKMINRQQLHDSLFNASISLIFMSGIAFLEIESEAIGNSPNSFWQSLFSTEWTIITIAFLFCALTAQISNVIIAIVKIGRYSGRIDHGE